MPFALLAGAILLASIAAPATAVAPAATASSRDAARPLADRSRELLDYRCANSLGVRQVTLFANGTVRVREGLGKEPKMRLGELGPVELEGYLRRLAAEDLSEVHDRQESTEGEWVERCTLHLTLDGAVERLISFGRYDSLPLQLAAVVRVADELAEKTRTTSELPAGYHARVGDVLRRADGVLFAVMGFTSDGVGIELQGVEQPLVVYVRPEDVPSQFEALVSRQMP